MLHETWKERTPIKKVEVTNTDAKKFTVADMLTIGKQYDVIKDGNYGTNSLQKFRSNSF